jgi:hypothetical protein
MYTAEFGKAGRDGFDQLWNDMVRAPTDRPVQEVIHGIQRSIHCCGTAGPENWLRLQPPLNQIPPSCCENNPATCSLNDAFKIGCGDQIADLLQTSGMLIAYVAVVFAGFMVKYLWINCMIAKTLTIFLSTARRRHFCLLPRKLDQKRSSKTIRLNSGKSQN